MSLPGSLAIVARTLRRRPGFAAVFILAIALAIAAYTAVFRVVHCNILQPVPFREPEALVKLEATLSPDFP